MATARWLAILILVTPVAVLPAAWGVDPMRAKNATFVLLALGGVLWLVDSWWLRAFLAWTAVVFVWSGATGWGLAGLLGIIAWTLVYQAAASLTETAWRRLRVVLAATALFQVAWLGVQALHLDPLFVPAPSEAGILAPHVPLVGWFGNPMDLSLFLGLALPAVTAVSPWLALPLAGAILALGATAGMVGVLVTACWLALPLVRAHSAPRRWAMRATLAGLALVGLTGGLVAYGWAFDAQGPGTRPLIWGQLVQLIQMSPVVGWGPNAIDYRVLIITPGTALRWNFGFNEYLQGAVELGLPGLVLALGFVGSLVWRLRQRWGQAGELLPGLITFALVAGFSIPLRVGPVALLAALYVGRLAAAGDPFERRPA